MNRVNKMFVGKIGKDKIKEFSYMLGAMPNTQEIPASLLVAKFKCMAKSFGETIDIYSNTQVEFIGNFYMQPLFNGATLDDTIRSTRCIFGKGVNEMIIDDLTADNNGVIKPIEFEVLCYMHPSTKSPTGYAFSYDYKLNEKHESMDNPFSMEFKVLSTTSADFNNNLVDNKTEKVETSSKKD
jgi:hypothetical protein